MKKFFLFFAIAAIMSVSANAQNNESQKMSSRDVTCDSLITALNKLQHDFDYYYCNSELTQIIQDLNILSSNIQIKTNEIRINCNHSTYNRETYLLYSKLYNACIAHLESIEGKYDSVKTLVALKMFTSNFIETEVNVLVQACNVIENCIATVETSLESYKFSLDSYKY